jgi:hypothetical protein
VDIWFKQARQNLPQHVRVLTTLVGGHIIGGPPSTIVQRTSPRNGASTTRTTIRTAREAVATNASVLDAATRQRAVQQPTHDENGQRMSTRERLRRARHTTPQASGSRGAGTHAVPIEVLSSPSSPEVEVVSWTRRVVQSTACSTTRTRHSVARVGARVRLVPPLSAETLYLTAARPPDHAVSEPHHMCGICRSVKEHPVSYVFGFLRVGWPSIDEANMQVPMRTYPLLCLHSHLA